MLEFLPAIRRDSRKMGIPGAPIADKAFVIPCNYTAANPNGALARALEGEGSVSRTMKF